LCPDLIEGMNSSDEAVEKQRKRLLYQSHHRGTKESDLFLGAFAGEYLPKFSPGQLQRYETLLAEDDDRLFDWIYRRATPPRELDSDVLRLLLGFQYRP
jgi:antitoxin CptB